MRITRKGFGRPNTDRRNWIDWMCHWACTAVLVSFAGAFISGAHDTVRWIS